MHRGTGIWATVGTVIGVVVAGALAAMVILLPAALQGSLYEITDPLVFMGVPMVVVGAGTGALLGVLASSVAAVPTRERKPSMRGTVIVVVVALCAVVLAVWTFLQATGVVPVGPLGVG